MTLTGGFVGRRSGKTLPALDAGPPRMLRGTDPSRSNLKMLLAELLFHCRPFVQLGMLMKLGRQSWMAWLTALAMDRASVALLFQSLKVKSFVSMGTRAARLELGEVSRRKQQLWWALGRSPVFDKFLKWPCEILDRIISKIPVLDMFRIMELV